MRPVECFNSLRILEDGSEFKYFGPGVGHIATEPNYSGGEQEIEELVNVVQLKPRPGGIQRRSGEDGQARPSRGQERLRKLRSGAAP